MSSKSPPSPLSKTRQVYLQTWGCQMNVLDSELMEGKLTSRGWSLTADPREADVILYNTCAIREKSVHKVASILGDHGRLKHDNPDLKIGVMGCVSQLKGESLFGISDYVDFVVGTDHLDRIDEIIDENAQSSQKRHYLDRRDTLDFGRDVNKRPSPFQAYVSVMRGCDLYCTYCVVPTTRGRERSRPQEEILNEVKALVDSGVTEVTFLGQTVNAYGRKDQCGTFSELLRATNHISGLKRIRFITSHPKWMTPDLIEAMGECEKIMPYLHLPVQSGSSAVLKRMKRLYTREAYLEIISQLKEAIPNIALASDFIIGFSGETDEDFLQTVSLLEEVKYQNSFIFKYSQREGTFAQRKLPDDVPMEVKKERHQHLLKVQEEVSLAHNQARVGQDIEVLVESKVSKQEHFLMGRDQHHANVAVAGDASLVGQYVPCRVTQATALTLHAKRI